MEYKAFINDLMVLLTALKFGIQNLEFRINKSYLCPFHKNC